MPAPAGHAVLCRGQGLPPRGLGIDRQPTLEGGIGGRLDADFGQHPGCVDLAGRFDDPGQHEIAEHGVALGDCLEPQYSIGRAQAVPQMGHLRGRDRQHARFEAIRHPGRVRSAQLPSALPQLTSMPRTRPHRGPIRCARSSVTPAARTTRPAPRSPPRRSSRSGYRPPAQPTTPL